MTKKKTIEVFKDINNPDYSDAEKLEAIDKVIMVGMCNKVSKWDVILAFEWVMMWYYVNG